MPGRLASLIAGVEDIPIETVEIPEWEGVKVEIRGMNGHQRAAHIARVTEAQEAEDAGERSRLLTDTEMELIISCVFDPESGTEAFTEDDIPMLYNKSGVVLNRLGRLSANACGLSAEVAERAGKASSVSVKTVRRTQPDTPNSGSTSDSPES